MQKKLTKAYFAAKNGIYDLFHKEDGAADIVAIAILVGVAVVLGIFFKDQLAEIITNLLGGAKDNTGNINETIGG